MNKRRREGARLAGAAGRRGVSAIAAAVLAAVLGVAMFVPSAGGVHQDAETCPVSPSASDHCADVGVQVTRSPAKSLYSIGETVTITVTVTNNAGPSPAPGTEIDVTIPSGLTLQSATPSAGAFASGTWTVDVAKDQSRTLVLVVTTNSSGSHSVTATLSGGNFEDFTPANNSGGVTIVVGGATTTTTTTTPTTSTPTGTTTTPTTTTTTTTTTTPESQPVEGEKINAEETLGQVLVKLPGQEPRPINPEGELLPPGTKIDATDGTVVLTSEYNGTFEQMKFWDGAFVLNQNASKTPVTVIKLRNPLQQGGASVAKKGKKRGKKKSRKLWGSGKKGHYRTTGRSGSATVRGTKWKTVDHRNRSTKFVLKRGKLAINDFTKRGKVDKVLKGKGTYIAKPKPRRRKSGRR